MKNVFILAGEPSGDKQGSLLIRELRKIEPETRLTGIGGDLMQKEGMELIHHIDEIAIMGFIEVVKHLRKIRNLMKEIVEYILSNNIKTVILIDYPGFNLRIAEKLKKHNIKIIYYISPQLWAWGQKRVKKVKRIVDQMIVILPFEKDFYQKHGVEVEYVGHPLVQAIEQKFDAHSFKNRYQISEEDFLINLQPGSRVQEIEKILPSLLEWVQNFDLKPQYKFLLPQASTIPQSIWDKFSLNQYKNLVQVRSDDYYEALNATQFVITASGTSTLEAAIFCKPMIIVYRVNSFTYQMGKHLIKIPFIGLVNIIAGKKIVPELIQNELNLTNLKKTTHEIINSEEKYQQIKEELEKVKTKLGTSNPAKKAAKIIAEMI